MIALRKKSGTIQSGQATWVSGIIMVAFSCFWGKPILELFGLDVASFAVAGAIVMFLIAMEMILGMTFFKEDPSEAKSGSIVPLAFPLIAGAGTLTTILSLRSIYEVHNILVGIVVNLIFVYLVLKSSGWLERKLGKGGFAILRKGLRHYSIGHRCQNL